MGFIELAENKTQLVHDCIFPKSDLITIDHHQMRVHQKTYKKNFKNKEIKLAIYITIPMFGLSEEASSGKM